MQSVSLDLIAFLFLIAIFAGGVDAIAGGGGLLTLPSLLLVGLPPIEALGTSKFQSLFGTGSASFRFWQKGFLSLKKIWALGLLCFVTSILGVICATNIPTHYLNYAIPVILILIALYFLFHKDLASNKTPTIPHAPLYLALLIPFIGFYDGIFGPGAGTFYTMGFVLLGGLSLLNATANVKFCNFTSNVGGFLAFALFATIHWQIGLVMAAGQFIGARIGASLAIRNGTRLIRPLVVIITLMMAAKIIIEANT